MREEGEDFFYGDQDPSLLPHHPQWPNHSLMSGSAGWRRSVSL